MRTKIFVFTDSWEKHLLVKTNWYRKVFWFALYQEKKSDGTERYLFSNWNSPIIPFSIFEGCIFLYCWMYTYNFFLIFSILNVDSTFYFIFLIIYILVLNLEESYLQPFTNHLSSVILLLGKFCKCFLWIIILKKVSF